MLMYKNSDVSLNLYLLYFSQFGQFDYSQQGGYDPSQQQGAPNIYSQQQDQMYSGGYTGTIMTPSPVTYNTESPDDDFENEPPLMEGMTHVWNINFF